MLCGVMITAVFTYVFAIPANSQLLANGDLEARWRSLDDGYEKWAHRLEMEG
jgi:hypothetical protein